MVDAADLDKIEASRNELHNLLEKPQVGKFQFSYFSLPANIKLDFIFLFILVLNHILLHMLTSKPKRMVYVAMNAFYLHFH